MLRRSRCRRRGRLWADYCCGVFLEEGSYGWSSLVVEGFSVSCIRGVFGGILSVLGYALAQVGGFVIHLLTCHTGRSHDTISKAYAFLPFQIHQNIISMDKLLRELTFDGAYIPIYFHESGHIQTTSCPSSYTDHQTRT